MHDAVNDLLNQPVNPHNVQRGIYGLFLGAFVLFSELSKNIYAQVVVDAANDNPHAAAHAIDVTVQSMTTFNTITAVSGFVVCVHSIIRFYLDMYDRFKPTKKRGARKMPGDSNNPRVQKIINAAKAVIEPVKNPSGWTFIAAFSVMLAALAYIFLCFAAPKVSIPPLLVVIAVFIAATIVAFKHAPRYR